MADPLRKHNQKITKHLIIFALFWLATASLIFILPTMPAFAVINTKTITTLDDFNGGIFYRTGTTAQTLYGGDGDGEVRLQTHGISPNSWYHTGNVTGLPAIHSHAAVFTNTHIYVAAGSTITDVNGSGNVYYTTIQSDHNLANWITSPFTLGVKLYQPGMAAVGNYLYVIGGFDSSTNVGTKKVYRSTIGSNGVPGAWSEMVAQLPFPRTEFATVVVSNTIYVIGGSIDGSTAVSTTFYARPDINGNISAWTQTTTMLNRSTAQLAAASYNGAIYVLGGSNYAIFFNNTEYVVPDSDGNITQPFVSTTTPLLNDRILSNGLAFGGEVYVVGGAINSGADPVDYISSGLIEANGTISNSLGWKDDSLFITPRNRLAAVASADGWIYAIGGFNKGLTLRSIDFGPTSSTGAAYVPAGSYTSRIFDLGFAYRVYSMTWNTYVSNTVSMTLQYKLGNSPDLSAVGWSNSYGAVANNAVSVTNSIDTSADVTQYRFFQFRVNLSTQNTIGSPVLNWVKVYYDVPVATSTPMPTGTPIPGKYADFIIPDMLAPVAGGSTMSYTINISVTNWGSLGFNKAPETIKLSKTARVGQQTSRPGEKRRIPDSIRASSAYTGTTNYFVYLDAYSDPSSAPTIPGDLGNCPAQGGGTNYAWIYALGIGETVNVALECYLTAGIHTYYAQVDTCDNPPDGCSATYGYVLELKENNNIAGSIQSGQTWHIDLGWLNPFFLPGIFKSGP